MSSIDIYRLAINSLHDKHPSFSYTRTPKALSNSEIFFVFSLIYKYRPHAFFESGFYKGRSSLILLECLKQMNFQIPYYIAVLHKKKQIHYMENSYPNLRVYYSPGEVAVQKLNITQMGALIDGPKIRKHRKVFSIYDHLLSNNASFICQHDLNVKNGNAKFRSYCKNKRKYKIKMLNKKFEKKFSYLDVPPRRRVAKCLGAIVEK